MGERVQALRHRRAVIATNQAECPVDRLLDRVYAELGPCIL